jgi:hypothetical protein
MNNQNQPENSPERQISEQSGEIQDTEFM